MSRLQRGSDPECVYFQQMANQGHAGGGPGSRQGTYVFAPSGKFLASVNSNNPERILRMLEEGFAAWEQLSEADRQLTDDSLIKPEHRWEDSYPADGLALRVINRDLPANCDPSAPCTVAWNQDQVWFSQREASGWLGSDPQPGDTHAVSRAIVSRLARLHFIDSVRGQTGRFSEKGIAGSEISTTVLDRTGSIVKLKIAGRTTGAAPEGWWQSANGVVTRLLGYATYDLATKKFTEFEVVALGRRWGYTRFNGRRGDDETGPLGFVLQLADPTGYRIAPAAISRYDADWVKRP